VQESGLHQQFISFIANNMKSFEVIHVNSLSVSCDGGGGALGHPKVYLHIDQDKGSIICPYCSRTYVLRVDALKVSGH
jgi:uncharacterized Zn-finger protein